jgi:DnaJ-class molecular chaperone
LRIKGRGFARGEAKGDQICVVRITVPKNLDDEDRKLVEQLRAKHPLVPRSELPW